MQFRGGLGLAFDALNQPQPNALAPLQITLTAAVIAACWAGCSAARVTQPCLLVPTPTRCLPERRTAARHPRETLPSPQRTNNALVFLSSC